MAGIEIDEVSI